MRILTRELDAFYTVEFGPSSREDTTGKFYSVANDYFSNRPIGGHSFGISPE